MNLNIIIEFIKRLFVSVETVEPPVIIEPIKESKEMKIYKVGDKLSNHFSYDEMTRSQTASRNNIDNTPSSEQVNNLIALCDNILEPVRVHFKKPVTVTSGFRCQELNSKIGSTNRSQHTKGEAADFVVNGKPTVTEVWNWIIKSDLDFDQVIQEFGRWIHVSFKKEGKNRHKCSIAKKVNGKTKYFHYTEEQIENGEYELLEV